MEHFSSFTTRYVARQMDIKLTTDVDTGTFYIGHCVLCMEDFSTRSFHCTGCLGYFVGNNVKREVYNEVLNRRQ